MTKAAIDPRRLERATGIISRVKPLLPGVYRVDGSQPYVVCREGQGWSCTCPDHEKRRVACKHILAVLLWQEFQDKERVAL